MGGIMGCWSPNMCAHGDVSLLKSHLGGSGQPSLWDQDGITVLPVTSKWTKNGAEGGCGILFYSSFLYNRLTCPASRASTRTSS